MARVFPHDGHAYLRFQQGAIPTIGNSLRIATDPTCPPGANEDLRSLAIRIDTRSGPICYLMTVGELQGMLEHAKTAPPVPKVVNRPDAPDKINPNPDFPHDAPAPRAMRTMETMRDVLGDSDAPDASESGPT